MHFHIIEEALFTVNNEFPRLDAKNNCLDIPSGIEKVEYDVNLNGYDHLILDQAAFGGKCIR